jgi:hypothetical protein
MSRLDPKDDNEMINGPGKYRVKKAPSRVTIIAGLRRQGVADEGQAMKAKP